MKTILPSILWCCLPWALSAQLYNDGGTLQINANAVLYVDGDVTNGSASQLTNHGNLTAVHLTNNANMLGDGTYKVSGDWTNNGSFDGQSTVLFIGSGHSTVQSNGSVFSGLEMRKENANLLLADDVSVNGYMGFMEPNNKVILAGNQFFLGSGVYLDGYNPSSYFVTGNDGMLWNENVGTAQRVFPVGFDETSYNPLTISQSGTTDDLGVRCLEHHFVSGTSGAHITTEVVDASWEIREAVPGGNDLVVFLNWLTDDELGFDRDDCAIGQWGTGGWDYGSMPGGAASGGNGAFYRYREGITEVGIFGLRSGMALTDVREAEAAAPKLALFPNPATDQLNVEFDGTGDYMLRVFDQNGRFVLSAENVQTLDVSGLPAGVYALLATSKDGETYRKFVIGR
jgi:hypothetical protein